ncbi:MAG: iron-sulfur cluster insertion protein ErpA [Euryarchaeota archaeon]|nr:iron-sulfur cluster insertion protein ErpA [Euryarchaeota archaeon]
MVQIQLTDPAVAKLKELIQKHGSVEDSFLRVYVAGGGCSGLSYGLALDNKIQEGDLVVQDDGVRVVVDDRAAEFMDGSTVDYVESIAGSGFMISNPNNWSTCGCGKSFNPKGEGAPDSGGHGHHHEH